MSELLPVPVPVENKHHTIFSSRARGAFLENLAQFGNVRLACRAGRVSPQTAYRARRRSAHFSALWDAALVTARTRAEEVLAERALNGVEEAVFYHGEEVARRRRYDSRLLLAHLARLDRLAEHAEVAAMLPALDEAIDTLKSGEELAEPSSEFEPLDSVPCVPDCWTCESAEDEENEELPPLERRLRAMEAARPRDARSPDKIANHWREAGRIEAAQLAAFEAGEAEWWLVMPGREGVDAAGAAQGGELPRDPRYG